MAKRGATGDDGGLRGALDKKRTRSMTPGLGDIMGGGGYAAAGEADEFTPLQRVVLSANGNLQRLISSYHNSPVSVRVRFNRRLSHGLYAREVTLSVFGTRFAVATSSVRLERADCIAAVEERGVGIGQLFRHLNILPDFELLAAGTLEAGAPLPPEAALSAATDGDAGGGGGAAAGGAGDGDDDADVARFWRRYVLSGEGVRCEIREVLRADVFALEPPPPPPQDAGLAASSSRGGSLGDLPSAAKGSFGDIMSPTVTGMELPDGFTPAQRLLLTANGNVERVVSSFYAEPVTTYVISHHKRAGAATGAVYDRQVAMLTRGRQFMLAKTTVFVTDAAWQRAAEDERVPVGALFRHMREMPAFALHSTGSGPGYFWRVYSLRASGMTCEINETFRDDVLAEEEDEEGGGETAALADGAHGF